MKILYILDTPYAFANGCWFYRNFLPGEALKGKGHFVRYIVLHPDIQQEFLNWPEVVVFTRTYPRDPLIAMRQFKRLGKKVVYEIDDNLWDVNPDNPSAAISTEKRRQYEHLMSEVDCVTTTTEFLANILRKFNKKVFICPNSVNYDIWKERPHNHKRLQIGYSGASSHWYDLTLITEVLIELQKKYDFDFILQGMSGTPIESEMYGYAQVLKHGLRPEQSRYLKSALDWFDKVRQLKFYHTPFYPPELFPSVLSRCDFDIGLAPLRDNRFNHSKSCVKFYEYTAIGAATLASDILPYSKEVGYCAKERFKDWYNKLEKLIIDEKFRNELTEKQKKWVKENRDLAKIVTLWEDAFDPTNI